jgi:3-oxoacyl-[acyl-carrier protein] reductase
MKTILITGASRGIGASIAEEFAKSGYNVVINYNNSYEKALELKEKLKGNIEIYKADVGDFNEAKELCKFCIERFGQIDVLVNNAGISQIKPFADISEAEWDEMMRINLKSVFNLSRNVIDGMIHRKEGKIINIASIWGEVGGSCEVHYSTAKAGIIGFTKALASELAL